MPCIVEFDFAKLSLNGVVKPHPTRFHVVGNSKVCIRFVGLGPEGARLVVSLTPGIVLIRHQVKVSVITNVP